MSYPIDNYIYVRSNKETYNEIVSLLLNENRTETTYEKFWPIPEGADKQQWYEENYGCTKGVYADADEEKQTISFTTNFDPSVRIIERLAQLFPTVRFEHCYEESYDEIRDMIDTYENGILVNREVERVYDDDEDEE